jgi:hypothetical protein
MRLFFFAALLVGCAPTLETTVRTTQSLGVAQRCSQGPFEMHVPAFGSRWGEAVTLEARGNAVSGHATVSVDGNVVSEETFASSGPVDSSACVLSDADRASAAPAATNATNATGATSNTTSTTATNAPTVALVVAALPYSFLYRTDIVHFHREVDDWSKATTVLKRGQDVKILVWSERPLDLQGTVFVLRHAEMTAPGGDDKKWIAHLDEVKVDAEKEAKKEHAEADAKFAEAERCGAVRGADSKCHDEGFRTSTEAEAYAELQTRCEDLARKNATDQACRDDGWRNENERPHATVAVSGSPDTRAVLASEKPADRPPPPPQTETPPPKPSDNAEWIAGSYQWNGSDWVWLGGGWRVPELDRTRKLTAIAPTAPPPTRIDARPPQPIASAVWADGYWHYASGRWIWVGGHWAIPPRVGATWRASTWVPDGATLRLDPGGWR